MKLNETMAQFEKFLDSQASTFAYVRVEVGNKNYLVKCLNNTIVGVFTYDGQELHPIGKLKTAIELSVATALNEGYSSIAYKGAI